MNEKRPRLGTGGVVETVLPCDSTTLHPPDQPTAHNTHPAVPIRDKLVWGIADLKALTGLSARLLERERAAGRMPQPDLRVGRRVLWWPSTIREWLAQLAGGGGA
jgi:hypothetical protein